MRHVTGLANASGLRSTSTALSSVHALTSVTDVSEQIKIKAVNILFPPTSWSWLFFGKRYKRLTSVFLSKKRAKFLAQRVARPSGECLSNGKQQFVLGYADGNRLLVKWAWSR